MVKSAESNGGVKDFGNLLDPFNGVEDILTKGGLDLDQALKLTSLIGLSAIAGRIVDAT